MLCHAVCALSHVFDAPTQQTLPAVPGFAIRNTAYVIRHVNPSRLTYPFRSRASSPGIPLAAHWPCWLQRLRRKMQCLRKIGMRPTMHVKSSHDRTTRESPCVAVTATRIRTATASVPTLSTSALRHAARLVTSTIAGAVLLACLPGAAVASSGCTQFNGTFVHVPNGLPLLTGSAGGNSLQAGEIITIKLDNAGNGALIRLMGPPNTSVIIPYINQTGQTASFTVPQSLAGGNFLVEFVTATNGAASWSCAAVSMSKETPPNKQLTAMQKTVTPLVAAGSAVAIAGATNGGIDASFATTLPPQAATGGGTGPVMLGASDLADDARRMNLSARAPSVSRSLGNGWTIWADLRGRGWRGERRPNGPASQPHRRHRNAHRAELGDRPARRLRAVHLRRGAVQRQAVRARWYHRRLQRNAADASLRWNSTLAWSRLGYDAEVPLARGSFDGSRWVATSSLTGSYRWSSLIAEPSITTTGCGRGRAGGSTPQTARTIATASPERACRLAAS